MCRYTYEFFGGSVGVPAALLAAGEHDMLRDFLEHSLAGAALTNEAVRAECRHGAADEQHAHKRAPFDRATDYKGQ